MPETRENYISVRYPVVSFVPSYREVVCDGTCTMDVVVDELSTGLSGYVLNVSLENHVIGGVVDVSYPSWARLNSTGGLLGDAVRLSAVDLDKAVEAGATNVTLATLTIKGDAPGAISIMFEGVRLDDDNGTTITAVPLNGAMSVYATIAADFSANATSGTVGPLSPFVVGFTDNSTGAPMPSSWLWSFGDNNTSTLQNPTYAYTAHGKYTVTLEVANPYLNDTETKTDYIVLTPYVETFPGYVNSPLDLDGDGLYEDINGNSRFDFDDIVALFQNMDWVENNANVGAGPYDLNHNGRIDYDDIVLLYHELLGYA